MRIGQIIRAIEKFAPPSLQESWDNTGMQIGRADIECTGVLVCFDVTPAIVEEAISLNYNLIVSHHPLFFKGIKRLTGSTPQEVCVINAIAAGISIYSSHTAIDSTVGGVSYTLARLIGITPIKVLDPLKDRLIKLQVTVPDNNAEVVRAALFDAGAGAVGNYDCCSFNTNGYGTFRAKDGATPYVGEIGADHTEHETEISVILPREAMRRVEEVLLEVHPYEKPAYQFIPILNTVSSIGLGIYGTIDQGIRPMELIARVKESLRLKTVRATRLPDEDIKIRRVAVCGGAGHSYIDTAISMGAQAYITADLSYHDFVDYQDRILLIDAGHYETEAAIRSVMADIIKEACPGFESVRITKHEDNPVNYL